MLRFELSTGPDRRLWCISSNIFGSWQSLLHPGRILLKLTAGHGSAAFKMLHPHRQQNRSGEVARDFQPRYERRCVDFWLLFNEVSSVGVNGSLCFNVMALESCWHPSSHSSSDTAHKTSHDKRSIVIVITFLILSFTRSRWKMLSVHLPREVRWSIRRNQSQCRRASGWYSNANTFKKGALRASGNYCGA